MIFWILFYVQIIKFAKYRVYNNILKLKQELLYKIKELIIFWYKLSQIL